MLSKFKKKITKKKKIYFAILTYLYVSYFSVEYNTPCGFQSAAVFWELNTVF